MDIVISSGHGLYVRGASCYIDEVDEARRVVDRVADILRNRDIGVTTYHDDVSKTQSENLERIVDFHNSKLRDLDVSVHFNAYEPTEEPRGTECLYVSQVELAADLAEDISDASGLVDRGAKHRSDLYFLNNTTEPAVLLEICFVDSSADVSAYQTNFNPICVAIARCLSDIDSRIPPNQRDIIATVFGGEDDYNVSAYDEDKVLNDSDLYVALPDRFEGERPLVRVISRVSGKSAVAEIWDVGPWNTDDPYWETGARPAAESGTDEKGRITNGAGIDLSPALAEALDIEGMGDVDWEFV
jgi:N-acetylmuramoyl-L-alanine amidase